MSKKELKKVLKVRTKQLHEVAAKVGALNSSKDRAVRRGSQLAIAKNELFFAAVNWHSASKALALAEEK